MTPPTETPSPELDDLAAEYVLGTLELEERRSVETRRRSEPDLDEAIRAWETRLGPLADTVQSVEPPTALKSSILARVRSAQAEPDKLTSRSTESAVVVSLQRRVARWRTAALGASALAAGLAGVVANRELSATVPGKSFVAVLQKDAQSPAFLMTVDVERRTFAVRTLAPPAQGGKSYELWLISQTLPSPKSLGIVGGTTFGRSAPLAGFAKADIEQATYAVTLEPEGGSPSGAPTGPVIYAGRLIQTGP